ncbi:MAG: D-serine ammonia-lyase [Lentisphaerae bacterium]|nr:D-serine ammonia-lyase [Lentisphaerota bacterium]MBR2873246.1 D-serine ammonia-lyase [Lentisphaeria bacterium]
MSECLDALKSRTPFVWLNPDYGKSAVLPYSLQDVYDAEARLARFAPLLAELFDEAAVQHGIIESELLDIPRLSEKLFPGTRMLLKADHNLPVAGSIKARGGIYNVLCFAEKLCLEQGILTTNDNYRKLASPEIRNFFGKYTVSVGSTGNLGLSIGTISAALGFKARVHMSADAKEWKKKLLRSRGVEVIEYTGDYSTAVAQGRKEAETDPFSFFVDDENSHELFLGYSVAALRIKEQLKLRGIVPDREHPLFVYLPCGVGGAPGGVCFGLKMLFGDAVHCFFAEPVDAPCVLLGLATGKNAEISVYDIGLTNNTLADGLAVGRASGFVGGLMQTLLAGAYTLTDDVLPVLQAETRQLEKLKIEPSAAAGFPGPEMVLKTAFCRQQGIKEENICHILWTTGGRYLPEE